MSNTTTSNLDLLFADASEELTPSRPAKIDPRKLTVDQKIEMGIELDDNDIAKLQNELRKSKHDEAKRASHCETYSYANMITDEIRNSKEYKIRTALERGLVLVEVKANGTTFKLVGTKNHTAISRERGRSTLSGLNKMEADKLVDVTDINGRVGISLFDVWRDEYKIIPLDEILKFEAVQKNMKAMYSPFMDSEFGVVKLISTVENVQTIHFVTRNPQIINHYMRGNTKAILEDLAIPPVGEVVAVKFFDIHDKRVVTIVPEFATSVYLYGYRQKEVLGIPFPTTKSVTVIPKESKEAKAPRERTAKTKTAKSPSAKSKSKEMEEAKKQEILAKLVKQHKKVSF